MSKKKARLLSIIMAVMMVMAFQPVTAAFAEDTPADGSQANPWVLEYGASMELDSEAYPTLENWRVSSSSTRYVSLSNDGQAVTVTNINTTDQDRPAQIVYGSVTGAPRFYITAKAQDAAEINLKFDLNYTTTDRTFAEKTVANHQTTSIITEKPEREGYLFVGWATSGTGEAQYFPGQDYPVNKLGTPEVTLYAVWGQNNNNLTLDYESLTAQGAEFTYDGEAHEISTVKEGEQDSRGYVKVGTYTYRGTTYEAYALISGIKVEATDAGTYSTPIEAAPVYYKRSTTSTNMTRITSSYIPVTKAELKINPIEITVSTESATKSPDGEALTAGGQLAYKVGDVDKVESFGPTETKINLIGEEYINIRTSGELTEPGTIENTYEFALEGSSATNYFVNGEKDTIGTLHIHGWGEATYTWADGNSKVTATRGCSECDKVQTEEVDATSEVTHPATCEADEFTTWTSAKFDNEAFEAQTKREKTGDATGHKWGEATYTWADDNSKVTATRGCSECDKVETEEVDTTPEVTQDATCEDHELTTWTSAKFANDAFEVQTKTETTEEAAGHDWGEATHTWADDNSKVTATRTCNECDMDHTEHADTIAVITQEANCEDHEITTWTSEKFTHHAFTVQSKSEKTGEATGHKWDEGKVTTQPTSYAEGVKTFKCEICGGTMTESIAKLAPGADPNQKGKDGTVAGPGASEACVDKAIAAAMTESGLPGSKYAPLKVKSTKQGKKNIIVKWTKVKGAKKYNIYGGACGKKNKMKKIASVTGNSYNVKKVYGKALKAKKYYKFMVVAIDGKKEVVSSSRVVHAATKGGKVSNPTAVVVKAKVNAKGKKIKKLAVLKQTVVKKGKVVAVKATIKKAKGKKVSQHIKVKFETSNAKVATVTAAGKIKGVGKGKCTIYAYAQNGVAKAVKITVK